MPQYAGKVDVVYIDPPYNTGNEGWCYNDRVNSPVIKEWFSANPVGVDDTLRHDKWCCMMWPRLKLLHELLAENGVIFISIDDNEVYRLRLMLDEIFGDANFIANVVWEKKYAPQNNVKWFSDTHDHIICYAKDKEIWRPQALPRTEAQDERYENPDNDSRGNWKSGDLSVMGYVKENDYTITTPSGRKVTPPAGRSWRFKQEKFDEMKADNRIWFGDDGDNVPSVKRFLTEVKDGRVPVTIWKYDEVGHNQIATQELNKLFGGDAGFPHPKPISLIRHILRIATGKNDALILDSFAGSGTTAHAVLEANKEDGGNRRFILVEMEDYADKITAERVKRVIKGYTHNGKKIDGLGGSFTYCELGKKVALDKILSGEALPDYDEFASILFHMATNHTLDLKRMGKPEWYLGEAAGRHVWMLYKPDLDWLKSTDAALTEKRAKEFAGYDKNARHLVIAPARYASQKVLDEAKLAVEYIPLPFGVYQRLSISQANEGGGHAT